MVLTGLDIGPSPTASEIARTLSDTLDRPVRYADPGALRRVRHARSVLHMEWGMVVVTTAIHTVCAPRQGRRDHRRRSPGHRA